VGFAPARKPRLVIAVVIDEPMIAHHGGTVAAPAFRRVMEASLRHLGVIATPQPAERAAGKPTRPAAAPLKRGPAASEAAEAKRLASGEQRVPDLLGHSARGALVAAQAAGFPLALRGSGQVVTQRPSPGEVAFAGTLVEVALEPPVRDAPAPVPVSEAPLRQPVRTDRDKSAERSGPAVGWGRGGLAGGAGRARALPDTQKSPREGRDG
jgi:hypothetical protein